MIHSGDDVFVVRGEFDGQKPLILHPPLVY